PPLLHLPHAATQPTYPYTLSLHDALPISRQMTDSYIASLQLAGDPGTNQAYSNCGYYLLGRIVAHLYGKTEPVDAYRRYLLHPLDRKSTRLNSSHRTISYAVFCLKKKTDS